MNSEASSYNQNLYNSKYRIYYIIFGFLILGLTISLCVTEKFGIASALWAPIIFIFVITQPKLAVYQFLFLFFTNIAVLEDPVVIIVDISAFILISSALLDYFLKPNSKFYRPGLLNNFIILILAVTFAALFGYKPLLALRPIAKLIYLTATFLAIHRLSRYFDFRHLLNLFFGFAIFYSLIALGPYFTGGKSARLFGLARATLDDILLITIPFGIIMMLLSDRRKAKWYLLGILIMCIAIVATQSRLSLMLTVMFSILAVYLVSLYMKKQNDTDQNFRSLKKLINTRIWKIIFSLFFLFGAVLVIKPDIVYAVWGRFEELFALAGWDTIRLRFVIWKTAAVAFWDHPILGIGPGMFKNLNEIYPQITLNSVYFIVQRLSAHNLILHFLAETGIIGGLAVVSLMIKQYILGFKLWKDRTGKLPNDVLISLFLITTIFLVSSFVEAGWLWSQLSYIFVFFLALVVRANELTTD